MGTPKYERVVRGSVASEHIVRLFDTHVSLAKTVTTFVAEGLVAGNTVLVIATRKRWLAVAKRLKRQGCDVGEAIKRSCLVFRDAAVTLASFIRRGQIDPVQFERVIGTCVSELAARSRHGMRIYGEMVDLLAEESNLQAAHDLEQLWNALSSRYSFTLLCGYASAHFADAATRAALRAICGAHTHVTTHSDDALGNWVLTERHTPAASHSESGLLHRELNDFRRARFAFQT